MPRSERFINMPVSQAGTELLLTELRSQEANRISYYIQFTAQLNELTKEIQKLGLLLQRQTEAVSTAVTEEQVLNIARVVTKMGEVIKEQK